MTPELKAVVEALYDEFKAPTPRYIEACPCCADEACINLLIHTPLRELDADHLSPYLGSLFHTVGNITDYKYFLPRIFELALTDPSWSATTEIVMDKLKLAEWQKWPISEKKVVQSFVDAWFEFVLEDAREPEDGIHCLPEVDALICGMAHADIALEPYFTRLLHSPIALRALYLSNEPSLSKNKHLANPFWQGHEEAASTVQAFLQSDTVLGALTC
ncbi:hypothetical protein [Asticcacaulis benevestitus]|nr:hypothetical protein [Asticcacaulis benevestitus]